MQQVRSKVKKRLEIGVVVLLLIGASLVARSLLMRSSRPKVDVRVVQKLTAPNVPELDRIEALLTLAKAKEKMGLVAAHKWIADDVAFYQSGGVTALSYYDDADVLAEMKTLFPKLDENVRVKALEAFSARPTAARIAWLQELTLNPDIAVETAAHIFLLTTETDAGRIKEGLAGVFTDFDRLEAVEQGRMVEAIANKFGDNADVQAWLVSLFNDKHPAAVQVAAILKLTARNASGLTGQIEKLVHEKAPEVRAAAIEAIPKVCPQGYWGILQEEASTESNMLVLRRVVDVLFDLNSQDAQKVLKTVKARDGKLSKDLFARVSAAEGELKAQPLKNVCASRSN